MAHAACTDCTFDGTNAGNGNTGDEVSGFGFDVLSSSNSGDGNTAVGTIALVSNTTGLQNTAVGAGALHSNTLGFDNTAIGFGALGTENTEGTNNTAIGFGALALNRGDRNIGVGDSAGVQLSTGNDNIDIGNRGVPAESDTIRIGDPSIQTATYIAGISGAKFPTPSGFASFPRPVFVDSSGHLATGFGFATPSSARYKRDVRDMGDASTGVLKLRPVSFRYKQDPPGRCSTG